jgi:hypothetical protein
MWNWLKNALGFSSTETNTAPRHLKAKTEAALSNELKSLAPGQIGWISFAEAAELFSSSDDPFSEWDIDGMNALGSFAAEQKHRSTVRCDKSQRRVYFTRS